jgi:hypothetical protein
MKVNIKMGRKMELENSIGQMALNIMENSLKIIFMEKDYIHGMIKEYMKVDGNTTKWKVKDNSYGLMEGSIMVNIKKIRKMDTEFLNGKLNN